MLPNGLDLGETVHVIRKASIRLSSSCSIALEDHPFISPRASKLLLCSPSHRNAWVHRGQSLELAIEVSWNRSFVDESEVDRVLEYICNALGDAEVEDSSMPLSSILIMRVVVGPAGSKRKAQNFAIGKRRSRFWRHDPSFYLPRRQPRVTSWLDGTGRRTCSSWPCRYRCTDSSPFEPG